jgi:hypothetical protein
MNAQIRELAFNLAPISELAQGRDRSRACDPLVEDGKLKVLCGDDAR